MTNCRLLQGGDAFDLETQILGFKAKNATRLDADGLKAAVLEELLFSPSFFEETFVVIENAQDLSDKAQELVITFAKKPTPKVTLLLHATGKNDFAKHMRVIEVPEVKPWDKAAKMADWVLGYLKAQGIKTSTQVAALIAATGTNDRFYLSQELEKIICYVGDKKEITLDDVQAIGALEHEETVWHLGDAFLQRDKAKAMVVLQQLLDQQVSAFLISRQLRNVCHQALMMLSLHQTGANVQEHFPQLRGKMFEKNFRLAEQAGSLFLTQSLIKLDSLELALKDSPFDETTLLMKVFI